MALPPDDPATEAPAATARVPAQAAPSEGRSGRPRPRRPRDRVVPLALLALLALVAVDLATGTVLVSTLGIVVVAVGVLAPPRAVLVTGAVAFALGSALVLTVHADDLAPLRLGNIAVGTLLAWAGATVRGRRERRVAQLEAREREAQLAEEHRRLRLQVLEAEHRHLFDQLQEALVPPLPVLPGTSSDLAYLPADDAAPSGGDLHDVVLLPDGTVHVLVVDVVGHGVPSTRDALRVVHLARALVLTGTPLGELLAQVDRLLGDDEDAAATAVALRYDPATGALEAAGAGHPPPLLVRAGGGAAWLEAPGRPVGYPLAGSDGTVRAQLEPGDTLVVYTDGLVEAGRDLLRGLEGLVAAATAARAEPVAGWAGRLVTRVLAEDARRDDVLVLALRRS